MMDKGTLSKTGPDAHSEAGAPEDLSSGSSLSRRSFLKTAALAAGGTVLVSCTESGGALSQPAVQATPTPVKFRKGSTSGPIKIGLLEDRSGNFALFGAPKYSGTLLAVEEINAGFTLADPIGGKGVFGQTAPNPPTQSISETIDKGGDLSGESIVYREEDEILVKSGEEGLLGREVELIAPDPQSDNKRFQSLVRRLVQEEKVDVLHAGFASAEREAIRPMMQELQQLYFYNNQYEGGVADKYTFCTGAIPEQQIIPVMQYMIANFGPRFYTLAADYNFGQLSAMWSRAMAPILGAEVIGEEFIPLSVSQFSSTISNVQEAKPDWLLMYITGENHSNYYPQANASGIRIPMGSSINMAQGYEHIRFSSPALAGMHVTINWMEELPTSRARKFAKRWRERFPDEPYISQQAQNAYIAVHLYAKAVRLAGTTDQEAVVEVLESGIGMEAPEGLVFMDPATHHLTHPIRLARADEDHNITFVHEWPYIEPWWTRRLGVNLVKHPEFKQYIPEEDPYFQKALNQ